MAGRTAEDDEARASTGRRKATSRQAPNTGGYRRKSILVARGPAVDQPQPQKDNPKWSIPRSSRSLDRPEELGSDQASPKLVICREACGGI